MPLATNQDTRIKYEQAGIGPALLPASYLATVEAAALLWIAAFAIYAWVYAPILTRERADGKAG